MKKFKAPVLALLMTASSTLLAQTATQSAEMTTAPGTAMVEQITKAKAKVMAVDPNTRTITLKRSNGKMVDLRVDDRVKNFDKIKVGDMVSAEFTQALSLELKPQGSGIRERSEREDVAKAPEGAQPAGTVSKGVTILADVVAVNNKDKTVTLRGPGGNLVDLKVPDPEQLKRVKKGNQVEATYTEALAVAVEPAPSASSGN